MPVENERKYVLKKPRQFFNAMLSEKRDFLTIRQGYLRGDARLRDIDGSFVFTYKHDTNRGLIEIETPITKADFDALWPHADRVVSKHRFSFCNRNLGHWDIDFLFDTFRDEIYFGIAECELPEGLDAPSEIPGWISNYIGYEVPRSRTAEFLNTRLGDRNYAEGLLTSLSL